MKETTTIANYTIDATGRPVGRVASEAAVILRGKNTASFQRNIKPTNKVLINNASAVRITGNKKLNKIYAHYSGYPGGMKEATLEQVIDKKGAREAIKRAIYGMLPNNKLRRLMMNNLSIKE